MDHAQALMCGHLAGAIEGQGVSKALWPSMAPVRCSRVDHHFTEMCCGNGPGSYLRLVDYCITQLKAQGSSGICNESKEDGEEEGSTTVCGSRVDPCGIGIGVETVLF